MSSSASIRRRKTASKGTRYQVRYRPGGRDTDHIVIATFATLADARECVRWANTEIAGGRRPNLKARLAEQAPTTVDEMMRSFGATQTGVSQAKRHRNTVARLGRLAGVPVDEVTGRDVQSWIDEQHDIAPSSIGQYLGQLRRAFDWVAVTPNPAAWRRLRITHAREGDAGPMEPPTFAEFTAVRDAMTRHKGPVVLMEATGMRINEALAVTWGDVDWEHHRIRVPGTKTRAARRWAVLWGDTRALLEATPREDRVHTARVFAGVSDQAVRQAMRRACQATGVRHLHPHDLRDRHISLLGLAGVPLPLIRDIAGHRDNTTTLDIYTGVLLDEPPVRLAALRTAVGRMTGLNRGAMVGPPDAATSTENAVCREEPASGGYRDRTGDLRAASATLSQLS